MAKKKVLTVVKIQIEAGKASPAPPVGTALGPHGIAIMDFVKAYNAMKAPADEDDAPSEIDLLIEISSNRSHEIEIPPVHDLAAVLGVSSESVSRAMAELKRSGALQRIAPRTYRYAAGDPAGGDRRLDP